MDTTDVGNKLGFHWQTNLVESTNDVIHLHNIEKSPPITPYWKSNIQHH